MATVSDTIECPHCGVGAYYEINTHSRTEYVFCERCGYSAFSDDPSPKVAIGVNTYGDGKCMSFGAFSTEAEVAPFREWLAGGGAEEITSAFIRLAPLYRTEFLRGEPQGLGDLSPEEVEIINSVLAPFEERLAAVAARSVYTAHQRHPGFRVFALYREADKLSLAVPGDYPEFLTIQSGKLTETDPGMTAYALEYA